MDPSARVVQSVLSPARAATRDRLIAAAIDLAADGGYDAVGVRAVAAAAGVSGPTAYQHFSSKDQLLVEALMALGTRSTESVRRRRPRGSSPAARLTEVFERIMREAARKPLLYQALYRAYVASGPLVEGMAGYGPERAAWIGEALRGAGADDLSDVDLDAVSGVLSTLFLGAMVSVAAGRDVDDVLVVLRTATARLIP